MAHMTYLNQRTRHNESQNRNSQACTHYYRTIITANALRRGRQNRIACGRRARLDTQNSKRQTIKDIEILAPSKNTEFDNYVLKALESLRFGFTGYPQKQGKQFLVFQSVITPDGVYPGFSGKLLKESAPGLTDQMDKLFE